MRVEPPVDQPFTGPLRELDRVTRVQPGTVVVLFPPGEPPRLRHPGEMLMPRWSPLRYSAMAMPVTTAVVPLRVVVTELTTLDRRAVDQVTLRLLVQIADDAGFAAVSQLAAEYGDTFGSYLMHQLQSKTEAGVRGAFRMNRLADLRHQTVSQILDDRWLPLTFAGGTLLRRGLTVIDVGWPEDDAAAAESLAAAAFPTPAAVGPARGPRSADPAHGSKLELSLDARLRRVWRSGTATGLQGIVGAQVEGQSTVIAVCPEPPSAFDTARLSEAFAGLFGDPTSCLVVISADDYSGLVRSWLDQVDHRHVAAQDVDSLRDDDLLRITLDRPLAPGDQARRGRPSLDGSEVEALRRLLPHRHVEFTVAR